MYRLGILRILPISKRPLIGRNLACRLIRERNRLADVYIFTGDSKVGRNIFNDFDGSRKCRDIIGTLSNYGQYYIICPWQCEDMREILPIIDDDSVTKIPFERCVFAINICLKRHLLTRSYKILVDLVGS